MSETRTHVKSMPGQISSCDHKPKYARHRKYITSSSPNRNVGTRPTLIKQGDLNSEYITESPVIQQTLQINTLYNNDLLIIDGYINNQKAKFLIDGGAQGNFISNAYAKDNSLPKHC